MKCNPSRWLWGLIPVAMLSWGTFYRERPNVETDLTQRATDALGAAGQSWAKVTVTGRDAVISGRARRDGQPKAALDAVRGVWGIRSVQLKTDLAGASAPPVAVGPQVDPEAVRRAKVEAERKAREEAEARRRAEDAARQKAEAEARARVDAERRARDIAAAEEALRKSAQADVDAQARAAAAAREQTQAAMRAQREAEARMKADEEAKAKRESDARVKAEHDRKARAEVEAREAEQVRLRAEAEAKAKSKAQADVRARVEAERKANEAEAAAAQKAKQEADMAAEARADAELKSKAEAAKALAAKIAEQEARAKSRKTTAATQACQTRLADAASAGTILFARAKADIDPRSSLTIARLAEIVKSCPGTRVEVEGHTDAEGEDDRNQRLSERRARAVVKSLVHAGAPEDRLSAVGYGAARPVASNDTAAGMAKNRRIEFKAFAE